MKKSEGVFKYTDLALRLLAVAIKAVLSFVAMLVILPSWFFAIQGFLNACFSLRENTPALMMISFIMAYFIVLFWIFWWFWPNGRYKKSAVKLRVFCLFVMLLFWADFYGQHNASYHNARIRFFETWNIKFYKNILSERATNVQLAIKIIQNNGLEWIDKIHGGIFWESFHWTGGLVKIPVSELLETPEQLDAVWKLFKNDSDSLFISSEGAYVFEAWDPNYAIISPGAGKGYSVLDVVPIYKRWVVFEKQDWFLIVRWCRRDLLCGLYY